MRTHVEKVSGGTRMSLQARAIERLFKQFRFQKILNKQMKSPGRSTKNFVPIKIDKKYEVVRQNVQGREVITFDQDFSQGNQHLIFFHGGGYIFEISLIHWKFLDRLADRNENRTTVINYPLSPESTYRETFEMLLESYELLAKTYPKDEFVIMGDSAGGGLALAFIQELVRRDFRPLPNQVLLLSPFLDMTLSNPDMENTEPLDVILSREFLNFCAEVYAGGDDKEQEWLSPINGSFNNLPDTAVFYSTHEMFYADCLKLKNNVKTANSTFHFFEYENMPHDWGILPIPERDQVIEDIYQFFSSRRR